MATVAVVSCDRYEGGVEVPSYLKVASIVVEDNVSHLLPFGVLRQGCLHLRSLVGRKQPFLVAEEDLFDVFVFYFHIVYLIFI